MSNLTFGHQQEVFEVGLIVKLFHSPDLQRKYLPTILPGLWRDSKRKLLVLTMKALFLKNMEISVDNILIAQHFQEVRQGMWKFTAPRLEYEEVMNILYDTSVSSDPSIFKAGYDELHNIAFANACDRINQEITYEIGYRNSLNIVSKAKAIQKIHQIIFGHKFQTTEDIVERVAESINQKEQFIKLSFSPKLTGLLGGWTKGWAGVLLGKANHGKSTLITYDSLLKAINNSVGDITAISTEEGELPFYQRLFAMILKIPLMDMRNQIVKITSEQIALVKRMLQGRIKFYHVTSFNELIDLLFSTKSRYIWIDHINSIAYPVENTTSGVKMLLDKQVEYLKVFPETVIVNLTQVNLKVWAQRTGVWKHPQPDECYGTQVLQHHSREFLSIYYPYKDTLAFPRQWTGKQDLLKRAKEDMIYIRIDKSSFGDLAEVRLRFNNLVGTFEDFPDKASNVEIPDQDFFANLGIENESTNKQKR